jgi:DNA-binding transcriptional LysR family regulator
MLHKRSLKFGTLPQPSPQPRREQWNGNKAVYSAHCNVPRQKTVKALDLDAVKAFVFVADMQSFTRAAEVLDTTQSAISLKLRRLEDQLGRRLLERTPRQVRLSAEGAIFLDAARSLVSAHEHAVSSFQAEQRRLTIGISHQIVGSELPRFCDA